ncbi:unnamed protein product [Rotaria sordida]|uniref:Uncharacterized protein n=1 Tax=Rotaria sordida TaxID=392033 RepID=A0A813TGS7_9BILA|nr:unnamed protein product [Rotaria sordida]CAF3626163.1 unnamed protein product [Rotaria sordida]
MVQIDSSTSVYDSNMPIGHQLYHLTNTIERLITTVGTSGMGDLHNDIRYLTNDFNNRYVTSASASGDS